MAQNVGSVEIDVDVDTRDLGPSIKRAADRAAKVYGERFSTTATGEMNQLFSKVGNRMRSDAVRYGRAGGEYYGQGFREESVKMIDAAVRQWNKSIGQGLVFGEWDKALSGFRDLDVGVERITARMELLRKNSQLTAAEFDNGVASLQQWVDEAKDLKQIEVQTKRNEEALREFNEGMEAMSREAERAQKAANFTDSTKSMNRYNDVVKDTGSQLRGLRQVLDRVSKSAGFQDQVAELDVLRSALARYEADFTDLQRTQRDSFTGISKDTREYASTLDDAARSVENFQDSYRQLESILDGVVRARDEEGRGLEQVDRVLRDTSEAQRRLNKEEESSFSILGRLSGSRNNFLHVIGNLGRAVESLPRLFSAAAGAMGGLVSSVRQGAEGLSGFQGVLGGVRGGIGGLMSGLRGLGGKGGFAGLAIAVGGAVVAFALLGELATSLAAGLSMLAGIVTALAASIGSALLGALLSLGPILGSVAVGAVAASTAFSNMSKEAERGVKPITDWWDAMRSGLSDRVFANIGDSVDQLGDVLERDLEPMLNRSATAVNEWGKSFIDTLDSGPMRENLKVFRDTWPNILTNLGDAFNSTFSGLSGVLAAISGPLEGITEEIADAADRFDEWANKAGNQNAIATWFEDAWESAKLLFGIIGNVAGALGNIFGIGKDEGDSMLESLESITAEFEKWTEGEGLDEIEQWFKDSKDLAGDIWDVLKEIGNTFDEWDTKETREDFRAIMGFARGLVAFLGQAITLADGIWESITFQEGSPAQGWLQDVLFGGEDLGTWWNENVVGWWNGTALPFLNEIWYNIGPEQGWWGTVFGSTPTEWWNENVVPWWEGTALPWLNNFWYLVGPEQGWWGAVFGSTPTEWWNQNVVPWWEGTALPWLQNLPLAAATAAQGFWNWLTGPLRLGWQQVQEWWNGTAYPWLMSLPLRAATAAQGFWNWLTSPIANAWSRVTEWWNGTAMPFFRNLPLRVAVFFKNLWDKMTEPIGNAWSRVTKWWNGTAMPFFRSLPLRVAMFFKNLWDGLTEPIANAWSNVTRWWNGTAMPFFRSLPLRVAVFFKNLWDGLTEPIANAWGEVENWWYGTALPWFRDTFSTQTLYSAGQNLIQGLINGIKSVPVLGTAVEIAGEIISGVKGTLGINSPSTVMRAFGQNVTEGLRLGMLDDRRGLQRAYRKLTDFAAPSGAGLGLPAGNVNAVARRSMGQQAVASTVMQNTFNITPVQANPRLIASSVVDRLARAAT